jgi:segregation and condensation protein A
MVEHEQSEPSRAGVGEGQPSGAARQPASEASPPRPDGELLEEEPEDSYKLDLPSFQGPLDLLLHLIKQHKIDIYDIPILLITRQYTQYLDAMQELDLDVAAEYIYMAALLIHLKSKMLLPRDEGAEEQEDPRADLVARLLEYQRFKAVAETFAELDVVRMGVWTRRAAVLPGSTEPAELDMSEVSLYDLVDAFRQALNRFRRDHPQAIEIERTVHKLSDKMAELVSTLKQKSPIRLQWFLEGRDRGELIAIFLGMLELVRLGGVSLNQGETFGEILIRKTEHEIDPAEFALYDS